MNRDFQSGMVLGMWTGAIITLFVLWTAGAL